MASTSKKAKKGNRADSDTDDVEVMDSSSPSRASTSKKSLCIICGGPGSVEVVKGPSYNAILQLYWCTLGVDVKPNDCQEQDTCKTCFTKLVVFFETNDMIVYFETYFKSLRLELLRSTLKGTAAWTRAGNTLTKPQHDIKQKYNDTLDAAEPEEERIRQTLAEYKMESQIIDDDNDGGGSRTAIKLTKRSYTH